jgi:hypothetical protein
MSARTCVASLRRGRKAELAKSNSYRVFARLTLGCRCILNRMSARVPMVTVPIWWVPGCRRGLAHRCHSPAANISHRHLWSGNWRSGIPLLT